MGLTYYYDYECTRPRIPKLRVRPEKEKGHRGRSYFPCYLECKKLGFVDNVPICALGAMIAVEED